MRTDEDALRSLARYVWIGLGEEWNMALAREDGTFERPFARVGASSPAMLGGSPLVPEMVQPFFIHAYPESGEDAEATRLNVAKVTESFAAMFSRGVDRGRPWRVPLYDYTGGWTDAHGDVVPALSLDEAADESRRDARDFMRVQDASWVPAVDPDDESLAVVTADIRMSWVRFGQVLSSGVITESVTSRRAG